MVACVLICSQSCLKVTQIGTTLLQIGSQIRLKGVQVILACFHGDEGRKKRVLLSSVGFLEQRRPTEDGRRPKMTQKSPKVAHLALVGVQMHQKDVCN
jgi:hypothetical protein